MDSRENKRDYTIDIMRALGLVLIIMAHTISNQTLLFQLRNFDVPMMIVVSGMSFYLSSLINKKTSLISYYFKRLVRLLLPTWVFLTIFFLSIYLYSIFIGIDFPFENKVLGSFLLGQGETSIGYVWIIRVFLLIALINPLLLWIYKKLNKYMFILLFIIVYLLYELALKNIYISETSLFYTFIHQYLYYLIPYSIFSAFGILLINLNIKHRLGTSFFMGIIIFIVLYLKYGFTDMKFLLQDYKYPAHNYYIYWGIFMSSLVSTLFLKIDLKGAFKKVISFFSYASLWIYFWHIIIIFIIDNTFKLSLGLTKFLIVFSVSLFFAWIHRIIFNYIFKLSRKGSLTRKFIKNAFLN